MQFFVLPIYYYYYYYYYYYCYYYYYYIIDANGLRRILASKSFKKSGTDLCEAIAAKTRRLCTECIDPVGIEAILANRLIPLDKGEGAVGRSVSAKLYLE